MKLRNLILKTKISIITVILTHQIHTCHSHAFHDGIW